MGGFQSLGDLLRDRESLIDCNRALSNPVGEGWPLHQLQHQGTGAFVFFNAVDLRDVRMVQAGKDLGLALKPGQPIRISGERVGGEFLIRPAPRRDMTFLPDDFCREIRPIVGQGIR